MCQKVQEQRVEVWILSAEIGQALINFYAKSKPLPRVHEALQWYMELFPEGLIARQALAEGSQGNRRHGPVFWRVLRCRRQGMASFVPAKNSVRNCACRPKARRGEAKAPDESGRSARPAAVGSKPVSCRFDKVSPQ